MIGIPGTELVYEVEVGVSSLIFNDRCTFNSQKQFQ